MTPFIAITIATVAASAAWTVQGIRYQAKLEKLNREHTELVVKHQAIHINQLEIAREQAQLHQQRAQQAQDAATARMAGADAALRRNRTELDRLRDATKGRASTLCLPRDSTPATTAPTDPAGDILGECSEALTDMARAADGHVSDVKMMQGSTLTGEK